MIDLHCHILPGIDDGAKTLDDALEMARIAVADGITTTACTPHIYPGMYMNDGPGITLARQALQAELDQRGIALQLVDGADVHLVPGLVDGLRRARTPRWAATRWWCCRTRTFRRPSTEFWRHDAATDTAGASSWKNNSRPGRSNWFR